MKLRRINKSKHKGGKARNKILTVRLNENEIKMIDEALKKSGGTTRGRFVRSLVLNALSN